MYPRRGAGPPGDAFRMAEVGRVAFAITHFSQVRHELSKYSLTDIHPSLSAIATTVSPSAVGGEFA
jgi:hypothetical protein